MKGVWDLYDLPKKSPGCLCCHTLLARSSTPLGTLLLTANDAADFAWRFVSTLFKFIAVSPYQKRAAMPPNFPMFYIERLLGAYLAHVKISRFWAHLAKHLLRRSTGFLSSYLVR